MYWDRKIPALADALFKRLPGSPPGDSALWDALYQRILSDRSNAGATEFALVSRFNQANEPETRLIIESRDKLSMSCTCQAFRTKNHCKHLFTILFVAAVNQKLPSNLNQHATITTFQTPAWMPLIEGVNEAPDVEPAAAAPATWDDQRQIVYAIEAPYDTFGGRLSLKVMYRKPTRSGWSDLTNPRMTREQIALLPDPDDRALLQMLVGAGVEFGDEPQNCVYHPFVIAPEQYDLLLKPICQTGRCVLVDSDTDPQPVFLKWDADTSWNLHVQLRTADGGYSLLATLLHDNVGLPPREISVIFAGGLFIHIDRILRLSDEEHIRWLKRLATTDITTIPQQDASTFLSRYFRAAHAPPLDLPDELGITVLPTTMQPGVKLTDPPPPWTIPAGARCCQITFAYGQREFAPTSTDAALFDESTRTVIYRDRAAECAALRQLLDAGARPKNGYGGPIYYITAARIPDFILRLATQGWRVEADDLRYRPSTGQTFNVSSGIDWFDLSGGVQFGEELVCLPQLLQAAMKGEKSVVLADGSHGLVPEALLRRLAILGLSAKEQDDHLRLGRSQAMLIDLLLADEPNATCDETFLKLRDGMQRFEGILPADPPQTFQGQLRDYQRIGLGWFSYLREFSLGGCLADDMGLGKTVQVLAMLEARRQHFAAPKAKHKPSLVVAPRSLMFNWQLEAQRFAPNIKVLLHTGADRSVPEEHWSDHDLILTTYGTLLRDIESIRKVPLDYAILDESQAIKNADTATSRAVRLLKADHRLALSGTPVENHLGELWNLLDFLNPGFIKASKAFLKASRQVDPKDMPLLSRAVRPFLLRRTKKQVARELPERTEKTLFCELEGDARREYEQLRDHYRAILLSDAPSDKMQILTALLRLRQAACHPGLIDERRTSEESAKIQTLIDRLEEVASEGHKALVFSQFVGLLSIVRTRLDALKIPYEYLDGSTQDRQQRVQHFQSDPNCPLFLISLKAGGFGLNLTAAEYVFLLDPWWNPAVEAQAIDRAHRIGQTCQVIAYRLITKDTVEEKVLDLQQRKRQLADAIITEDGSLLATLTRDDLQLLLS